MKKTMSIVVGGSACNARCPYCVSKLTGQAHTETVDINLRNFNKSCQYAKDLNISTVLLTGKGEPLLYPKCIFKYVKHLKEWNFPFIEIQTNGILLSHQTVEYALSQLWVDGVTTICLSCVHWQDKKNKEIFGQSINLLRNIKLLRKLNFTVRVCCVGVDGYVDNIDKVVEFTRWCKKNDVDEFTWRPVANVEESDCKVVKEWINKNSVKVNTNSLGIHTHFKAYATALLDIGHGATVYDFEGQNICLNNCLTRDTDMNNIRQLIFFPDGSLRYDWVKEGAVLLR